MLLVGLGVSGLAAALIPLAPNVAWLGVAVGLYGFGDALFTPTHRDTLTFLSRATTRAGTVGAHSVLRKVGSAASPVAFGAVLATAGFGPLFVGTGGVFLVYAAGVGVWFDDRTA
jgi:hypothetical protein